MTELNAVAPNYRRAVDRWAGAPTLESCYRALSACFNENPHGMIEHVKSIIESVCITILVEYGRPLPSSTPSATELFVAAIRALGIENTKGASKLDRVVSTLNRLLDTLSEMRNEHGGVAHGKDAFLEAITVDQARVFLHTGDAILSFLLNALEGKEPNFAVTREPYDRFIHHHQRIDRSVRVEASVDEEGEFPVIVFNLVSSRRDEGIPIRVEPSRLLYGIDRGAYIEVLRMIGAPSAVGEDAEESETGTEEVQSAELVTAHPVPTTTEIGLTYDGPLGVLKPSLEEFLRAEGLLDAISQGDVGKLVDLLLINADTNIGVDWKQRQAPRARLKRDFKRVLIRFGLEPARAGNAAERLVAWMRVQAPEAEQLIREQG